MILCLFRLTGDIRWPSWTDFAEALGVLIIALDITFILLLTIIPGIGPLAGSFPLLSLRTNKADVAVGIDRATVERLDLAGENWRVSGRSVRSTFLDVVFFSYYFSVMR